MERISSTISFLFKFLQYYLKAWFKLVPWLRRYRILEKMYVWFYIVSVYSNSMTNIKKSYSSKQFYFYTFFLNLKFCWNRYTGWKVENVRYIPPYSSRQHRSKGLFPSGPIISIYKKGQKEHPQLWVFYPVL